MKKLMTVAIFATIGNAAMAQNATSSASQNVKLALSNAIEITFAGNGTNKAGDVTIPFNTVNDYANGVESGEQLLNVRSNKDFNVAVKTGSATFAYTGSTTPAPVMPVEKVLNLVVSANNTGGKTGSAFTSFGSLSNSDQDLIEEGSRGGNQSFAIKYKATPGFAYPAGSYSVDVVYTATQK